MLFDEKDPPAAQATPLFSLPLPCHAECGGCQRFVAINPFTQVSGRCKIGILPGVINRRVKGCLMHRPRGVPATFQDKPVRP